MYPTRIDQNAFQGLPYRPPFVPNIPTRFQMGEHLKAITGLLMQNVLNGQNQSVLRYNMFNRVAANNFDNQSFVNLVSDTVDYAEMLIYGNQMPIEQAINKAVHETVMMTVAREVELNPGIWNQLEVPVQQAVTEWLSELNKLGDQLSRWVSNQQNPNQGYNQYPPNQQYNQQYNQRGYNQMPQQYNNGYQPQYNTGGFNQGGSFNNRAPYGQQPQQFDAWNTPSASAGNTSFKPRIGGFKDAAPKEHLKPAEHVQMEPKPVAQAAPTPLPHPVKAVTAEAVSVEARLTRAQLIAKGYFVVDLFPPVYTDLYDFYYTFKDGAWHNTIKEASVHYSQHKNHHLLKSRIPNLAGRLPEAIPVDVLFTELMARQTVEEILRELEEEKQKGLLTSDLALTLNFKIPLLLNVASDADYRTPVQDFMLANGVVCDIETSTVTYTSVEFASWCFPKEAKELAYSLARKQNYAELRSAIIALRKLLPFYLWDTLESKVTSHVNEMMQTFLRVDYKMDSFVMDIEEITNIIVEEHPDLVELFSIIMFGRLCDSTLDFNSTEDFNLIAEEEQEDLCSMSSYTSVTLLPYVSNDLKLNCAGDSGLVCRDYTPGLHGFLESIVEHSHPNTRYFKLVTLDNQVIYYYPSNGKQYVVSTKPF